MNKDSLYFHHFLKVVYSRACESRGVWIKVRKLKRLTILTILFSVLVSNLTGKARESCNALLQESGNILAGIPARPRIHLRKRDQAFFNK